MTVACVIANEECSVRRGVWTAEDGAFERALNAREELNREEEIRGSDPDPDHTSAVLMANALGGTVVDNDGETADRHVKGRIY